MVEIERPQPKAGQVLLRVNIVALNASDHEFLTGSPLYARIYGLRRPSFPILGSDVAGTVVAVGQGVDSLTVGDEVFGDLMNTQGGCAEYLCAPAAALFKKPPSLQFSEVACLPQAGLIALQAMKQARGAKRILVNGGGGGAGCFMVQLAKLQGAHVTAVDNAEKLDCMKEAGADEVHDYRQWDFAQSGQKYDFILDLFGTRSATRVAKCLEANGKYSLVGGTMFGLLHVLAVGALIGAFSKKKIGVLALDQNNPQDIAELVGLLERKELKVMIDRTFPLEETAAALSYLGGGHVKSKAMIKVA